MSSPDSSPQQTPQRLSNLYQYHNAPEVAPAHGLEYDDNIYPVSDKYPVINTAGVPQRSRRRGLRHGDSNKPPLIIFGMKLRTFLVVALVIALVVVGAAVGGAVGGRNLSDNGVPTIMASTTPTAAETISASAATSTHSTSTAASTYTAPTPTFRPLNDCPSSNNTLYVSEYASGTSDTGLNFTKYCNVASPLKSTSGATTLSEAYVYTFDDCIEVCAGYNFWHGGSNCTAAVYTVGGARPGNCWVGTANSSVNDGGVAELTAQTGTNVALLT